MANVVSMMLKMKIILFILHIFSYLGYKLNTGYILGGVDAARGEFPFAVLLGYKNAHRASKHPILYRCGGSLINR